MQKTLKIYYTSDTHGKLFPENSGAKPCLTQCFAEYQKDENTLVLDGGDTLQGSPLLRYLWNSGNAAEVLAPVMNSSGMDYYTIGNHDFNYGYAGLASYVRAMNATCICANVQDDGTKNGDQSPLTIRPYVIHTLGNGLRVGIVGIVTDHVSVWEAPENLEGFRLLDAFTSAKVALGELQKEENNIDYTICIYHGGFAEDLETGVRLEQGKENIACDLCRALDFDLVLTAHQHMEQPLRQLHGTSVLQLPPNGEKYAALEIAVVPSAKPQNGVANMDSANMEKTCHTVLRAQHCVPTAAPSETLLASLLPQRTAALEWLSQPAGSLAEAIPVQREKASLALHASGVAHLANFAQQWASGAEVAITSLPNDPVGLPKEMTIGDVLTAYPFPNQVITLAVPGAVLAKGIARSASYFAKDETGAICVASHFVKPKEEHYNYDYFGGVEYTIAFAKGETTPTVQDVLVGGKPLDPEKEYTVVMSDYRATGTGGYPFYAGCKVLRSDPSDLQSLMLRLLKTHPNFAVPTCSAVHLVEA